MKYARIEDGLVKEIGEFDSLIERFHPSLVWVECPDAVKQLWTYTDGVFSEPAPKPPTPENIKGQIALLDLKRIRPLAEGDTVYLAKLNEQVVALRAKLQ